MTTVQVNNRAVLRRLRNLERVFDVEPKDDWIDVVMWNGLQGGLFGHAHYRISESGGQTELIPCSDGEEIEIMREHFEESEHKIPGTSKPVGFSKFLEYYSYLGSEELRVRRKSIIEQLRRKDDRIRVEDSSRRAC